MEQNNKHKYNKIANTTRNDCLQAAEEYLSGNHLCSYPCKEAAEFSMGCTGISTQPEHCCRGPDMLWAHTLPYLTAACSSTPPLPRDLAQTAQTVGSSLPQFCQGHWGTCSVEMLSFLIVLSAHTQISGDRISALWIYLIEIMLI